MMRTRVRTWRHLAPWCASLLLVLLAVLAACGGSTGASTGLTAQAAATATFTPFATLTATASPAAANTPRPTATATPAMGLVPTATPTSRPRPTATPTVSKSVTIKISGFAFSSPSITIAAGTTVEWVNLDSVMHTTTSNSGDPASWNSGPLATKATFSFTFTAPGTYGYHCAIHPFMTGTITVTA